MTSVACHLFVGSAIIVFAGKSEPETAANIHLCSGTIFQSFRSSFITATFL